MKQNRMTPMTSAFLTIALTYVLFLALVYCFQRHLLYHPDKTIATPAQYGLENFTEYFVPSSDGVTIQLWYRSAAQGMPTVVYFHGNAANLGNRAGIYGALAEKGFGVLAVSYRGYGKSTGSPSEQGLYADARAALSFLTDKQHIPLKHIILFGESLGTGVAVQMATEYDVGGLVLEAAYTSVAARGAEIYFYIPVKLMIRDKFDSLNKIGKVKAPLLLFHGERDSVIPIRMGKAVFAAATAPKQAFYFPRVDHNDFDNFVLAEHVLEFLKTYRLIDK